MTSIRRQVATLARAIRAEHRLMGLSPTSPSIIPSAWARWARGLTGPQLADFLIRLSCHCAPPYHHILMEAFLRVRKTKPRSIAHLRRQISAHSR